MERYALLFGTKEQNRYCQLAGEPGALDYLTRCGSDNPPRAAQVCSELLRGFDVLEGYGSQPVRERPVTVRYAPVSLSRREDMPNGMRSFYALSVSGKDTESGKEAGFYDYLVLLDREELLKNGEYNYLDHLFGTYLLNSEDLNRIRRKGTLDCGKTIRKVMPVVHREDKEPVFSAVEAIFAGRTLVIRLEKGMVFNTRAMELLAQIYSLLPARLAIETGFASYQDPIRFRGIMEDTGIRVYVVPAETSLEFLNVDAQVLDLNDPEQVKSSGGLLVKCLRKWSQLSWQDRCDAMAVLFENVGSGIRDVQVFARITSDFFGDPFFHYVPQPGTCKTLEELKEAFDPFQVLKHNIPWVRKMLQEKAVAMLAEGVKLSQLKAEAAAKARTAASAEERKKYTALYRFAQKLDPSDASLYAIVSTEEAVEARFDVQKLDLLRQQEQKLKAEAELALSQALEKQKAELEAKLAAREKELQEKLKKELAAKDQSAKTAQQAAQKNLDKATSELQKLKSEHAAQTKKQNEAHASEIQKLNRTHSEEVQKLNRTHTEEVQKLKSAQAEEVKTLKAAQTAELQKLNADHAEALRKAKTGQAIAAAAGAGSGELKKQITDLTISHQAEMQKLREAHAKEIQSLKEAHARALAARPAPDASGNSAQEVSSKAKQLLAAQLMGNLSRIEELKRAHQEELEKLRSGSQS